jgi:hypothetical protein
MNPKFQPDFSAAIKFLKETKLRLKPEISVEIPQALPFTSIR